MSLAPRDKSDQMLDTARRFSGLGYEIVATEGTASWLATGGVAVSEILGKISLPAADGIDAEHRSALDLLEEGGLDLIVNTPRGRGSRADGAYIRSAAAAAGVAIITTASGAAATVAAIETDPNRLGVRSLQEWHATLP